MPPTDPRLPRQLGAGVRTRRDELGWTQEELAELAGLHRTYVTKIEGGKTNVTLGIIARLAHVLGTTPSELLEGVTDGIDPLPPRPEPQ